MNTIDSPTTRDEILSALDAAHRGGNVYWQTFDLEKFFAPIGEGWSPADTVRHLNKGTRPVAKALGMPRVLLRMLFGKPRRRLESYDSLVSRYQGLLAAGGRAGRFAPSRERESDLTAWRKRIMNDRAQIHEKLVTGVKRWSDPALDRLQLPHPLLGKLSVREMLFFTLYHQIHHVEVVRRKLTP